MPAQVPVLLVSSAEQPALDARLSDWGAFPLVNSPWPEASAAVADVKPGIVIADLETLAEGEDLETLAKACDASATYTPLVVLGSRAELPQNALPFALAELGLERLEGRLNAALRVRSLHEAALRRLSGGTDVHLPDGDPMQDATVLLVGRSRSYAPLSVAFGQRAVVIGTLAVEAGAKQLNAREIDGVVLGEGFSPRVAQAFLMALAEDARFRGLPVIVCATLAQGDLPDLPNLDFAHGTPDEIVSRAVPLIRQQAFAARLSRVMAALDADGLLDPTTGLMTVDAFERDWHKAVDQAIESGQALSAARFVFEGADARSRQDAARILGRLLRATDFAALHDDAIVTAFAQTDLRSAHVIARRLAGVLRQTTFGPDKHVDPLVTLATVKPDDTPQSVFQRLSSAQDRAVG